MTAETLIAIAIGFVAQLIDGTLGMGYGIVSTSALLGVGVTPLQASATVHFAEILTTGASSGFHLRRGNVSWPTVRLVAIAGAIGGAAGALLIVWLTPLNVSRLRDVVAAYLLIVGVWLVWRATHGRGIGTMATVRGRALGFAGGFFDAFGGGWGPIVTSNLVLSGLHPRMAVGSSIVAEFFVTAVHVAVFAGVGGLRPGSLALGLLIGGLIAAPITPLIVARTSGRPMTMAVGIAVVLWSVWLLVQ